MHFGASVWPFQWQPPYEPAIRRIAALGFTNVELIAWNRESLADYYTHEQIASLKHHLEDEGVTLSEFVSTPPGLASADAGKRAAGVEHFKQAVEVAVELGTGTINSVVATPFDLPMPRMLALPETQEVRVDLPPGLDWAEGYRYYVESLRHCCDICEAAGLHYALETHPYRWATTAIGLNRLFERVESPALGCNFDPSHLFPCGEIPQLAVYQLGDRIFHCHFSDNDGSTNAHWRPGKGKIDWAATLFALRDVGFDGVISIELEDVPGRASSTSPTATEVFERENVLSRQYIAGQAASLGIAIE